MARHTKRLHAFTIDRAELVKRLALYRLEQDARALAVLEDLLLWFAPAVRLADLDAEITAAAAELAAFRRARPYDD